MLKLKRKIKTNGGMTYVELIVVLTIFASMTSVVLFDYGRFQGKVDIKNLANDIALKVVEAQKSSLNGKLPATVSNGPTWKPSYGVYFFISGTGSSNKDFVYYTDSDQSGVYNDISLCPSPATGGECLEKIRITRGSYVSDLSVFYQDGHSTVVQDLSINFTRPSSSASIRSNTSLEPNISYAQITVNSLANISAKIKVYASGRIQIN